MKFNTTLSQKSTKQHQSIQLRGHFRSLLPFQFIFQQQKDEKYEWQKMAAFPPPATRASCQPHFGVVPRQRHTTWRTAFCLAFLHCLLQQKPCPNNWTVRAITRAVIGQLR